MSKKQFRIGELSKALNVEKYVIRFWEKEFSLAPDRSAGGQRFYTEDDLISFQHIKTLLYDQGFTISGARKQLASSKLKKNKKAAVAAKQEETIDLVALKNKLLQIKEML